MSDYYISQIYPSDKRANDEVDALLTLSQQEAVLATPYDVLP